MTNAPLHFPHHHSQYRVVKSTQYLSNSLPGSFVIMMYKLSNRVTFTVIG